MTEKFFIFQTVYIILGLLCSNTILINFPLIIFYLFNFSQHNHSKDFPPHPASVILYWCPIEASLIARPEWGSLKPAFQPGVICGSPAPTEPPFAPWTISSHKSSGERALPVPRFAFKRGCDCSGLSGSPDIDLCIPRELFGECLEKWDEYANGSIGVAGKNGDAVSSVSWVGR